MFLKKILILCIVVSVNILLFSCAYAESDSKKISSKYNESSKIYKRLKKSVIKQHKVQGKEDLGTFGTLLKLILSPATDCSSDCEMKSHESERVKYNRLIIPNSDINLMVTRLQDASIGKVSLLNYNLFPFEKRIINFKFNSSKFPNSLVFEVIFKLNSIKYRKELVFKSGKTESSIGELNEIFNRVEYSVAKDRLKKLYITMIEDNGLDPEREKLGYLGNRIDKMLDIPENIKHRIIVINKLLEEGRNLKIYFLGRNKSVSIFKDIRENIVKVISLWRSKSKIYQNEIIYEINGVNCNEYVYNVNNRKVEKRLSNHIPLTETEPK